MRIWFHGTSKENADGILLSGFREGTYFARHLEDAIEFGGLYVFEVAVAFADADGDGDQERWQVVCDNTIPAEWILRLHRYDRVKLYENQERRRMAFPEFYGDKEDAA